MPCKPRKARLLLKEGKARVVRRTPFVIQLVHGSSGYKQKVFGGQDPGLTQGAAAVRNDGKVLFHAEVKCRPDISEKLAERRSYRKGRRYRFGEGQVCPAFFFFRRMSMREATTLGHVNYPSIN